MAFCWTYRDDVGANRRGVIALPCLSVFGSSTRVQVENHLNYTLYRHFLPSRLSSSFAMSVALQLARSRTRLALSRRCLATAAAHPGSSAPMLSSSADASEAVIPLSNVEAQWEKLGAEEQRIVHRKLEEIQKKDWKALSIDEKKAGALHVILHGSHDTECVSTSILRRFRTAWPPYSYYSCWPAIENLFGDGSCYGLKSGNLRRHPRKRCVLFA